MYIRIYIYGIANPQRAIIALSVFYTPPRAKQRIDREKLAGERFGARWTSRYTSGYYSAKLPRGFAVRSTPDPEFEPGALVRPIVP